MIISRTPYRVSFFGGGTDYPKWYRENGGAVLSTTIDKYCYISCRYLPPFFEHKHRIIYSQVENVKDTSEIKHPAVKAVLEYLQVTDGLEIHHDGDLPARSGLGSSSAFTVGLLNAVKALKNEFISKSDLGLTAIHIEQNIIKETVGSQDQIAVANGGFNRADFKRDGTIDVTPLIMNDRLRQDIHQSMMLFFTGIARFSTDVAKTKVQNFEARHAELSAMHALVDEAAAVFQSKSGTIEEIGKLLHQSWLLKRSLSSSVSNQTIDDIYEAGRSAGALGGKVLGAGGGGFVLLLVRPQDQAKLKERLTGVLSVTCRPENTGSKIVVYDPQI